MGVNTYVVLILPLSLNFSSDTFSLITNSFNGSSLSRIRDFTSTLNMNFQRPAVSSKAQAMDHRVWRIALAIKILQASNYSNRLLRYTVTAKTFWIVPNRQALGKQRKFFKPHAYCFSNSGLGTTIQCGPRTLPLNWRSHTEPELKHKSIPTGFGALVRRPPQPERCRRLHILFYCCCCL